ncbi:MAG: winged helix-turn-helix transcriptional regulator, partial [Spirochaetaceae bacterium]|nr:winged helix-turn-helix transcriptional regulator [Spirochaetaceae bacterium]
MITMDFSQRGSESLTDFLYLQLKNQILEGSLGSNQKLPSKRSLASHLGVSVITVQNAYQQLIDEGYVYSQEKRGYFVTELEAFSAIAPVKNRQASATGNQQKQSSSQEILQKSNHI